MDYSKFVPIPFLTIRGEGQGALPKVIKHCINVCMLVVEYHQHLNSNEQIKTESAVAALLHYLGFKRFSEQSPEVKYYMTHAEQTIKALKGQKFITPTMRDLILFHEENLLGTGPMKKKDLF